MFFLCHCSILSSSVRRRAKAPVLANRKIRKKTKEYIMFLDCVAMFQIPWIEKKLNSHFFSINCYLLRPMSSAFSPLAVIDNELMSLFTTGKAVDSEMHLTQLFDHLDDDDIPYLTLNAIKSGSFPANSLVRYRCLVQVRCAYMLQGCCVLSLYLPGHA